MRYGGEHSRLFRNDRAQSALIDASLFFVILVLASVFLNLTGYEGVGEVVLRKDDIGYTRDALDSLTKCSINRTNYTKFSEGAKLEVELLHKNVLELMIEDLMLRHKGYGVDFGSVELGIERPVGWIADNLTAYTFANMTQVRNYHYLLTCSYRNVEFRISDSGDESGNVILPPERYSAQRDIHMPASGGTARITLLLWAVSS